MTTDQYASLQKHNAAKNEHKFWICEIETSRNAGQTRFEVVTHFGRIGTSGQRKTVATYNNRTAAINEAETRTRKKQKEGYDVADADKVVRQIDEAAELDELDDLDDLLNAIEV